MMIDEHYNNAVLFVHLSRQSSSVEGTGMLERRVSPELVEAGDPLSI